MSGGATRVLIVLGLGLAVAIVFAQTAGFQFIDLDDRFYVADNPNLRGALDASKLGWAFTTFRGGNWHPLTWISLMSDQARGGGAASAFHVTNVLLHAAATLLLFWLLATLTADPWPSGCAALLFGVHPLHVESVAWVVERKDTLSTVFGLLAILAWVGWVRKPSRGRSLAAVALLVASLMSKPMFVTLPFALIALDIWPLERFASRQSVTEKLPLFVTAVVGAFVALVAQRSVGAVAGLAPYPIGTRCANAAVSAVTYLAKAVWPAGLATPYPYDAAALTPLRTAGAIAVLAALAALAWRSRRSHPWIASGAAWYAVTLVPVLGLVQVGSQPMADRYTYVPLIGPFYAASFEAAFRLRRVKAPAARAAFGAAAAVVAACLLVAAHAQASLWRDSRTLFTAVVQRTGENSQAEIALSSWNAQTGNYEAALAHAKEAVRISPRLAQAHGSLAFALTRTSRFEEAAEAYATALGLSPQSAETSSALGNLELRLGRNGPAETHLRAAVASAPRDASARKSLGVLLARTGRIDEAVAQFEEAARLDPSDAGIRANLERALGMRGGRGGRGRGMP